MHPLASGRAAARFSLRARAYALALCWALAGAVVAQEGPPRALLDLLDASEDDPRAALTSVRGRLEATHDAESRFWLLLAQARAHDMLEEPREERRAVEQAGQQLAALHAPRADLELWLRAVQLPAAVGVEEPARLLARMTDLRRSVLQSSDERLRCEFTRSELWLLTDNASYDEAWIAAEELERCGRALGLGHMQAIALATMGDIGAAAGSLPASSGPAAPSGNADPWSRALAALGPRPMRFRRSLIEYSAGTSAREQQLNETALMHLERARALSRAIDDRAGIAAADIAMAHVHLQSGTVAAMPPLLDEAQRLLEDHDDGLRISQVMALRVRALARMQRPEVLAQIDQARRWDRPALPAHARTELARALAQGYASQGQWQRAYAELERADEFEKQGKAHARDVQVLRLQSRYEAARRDAENAALRHRNEAAQLALEAQTTRQRALWLALAALAVLAGSVGLFAWRGWRRRRTLLDLALKDPLTGNPNRRAVTAYAQAQLEQTRRLSMPLSVAMIDLDHFKRVNDGYGHAAGDELLRAFAQASHQVLRGQDRLGRWGGEEWLLVMPGTPDSELPHVFERLRERFAAMPVAGLPSPHGCTFSMGCATTDGEAGATTLAALLARADENLYRAKADGRDAVR